MSGLNESEAHLIGPDAAPGQGYDPPLFSLRQRELAKVAELAAAGEPVVLSTVQRKRRSYQTRGLWGLIDGRIARSVAGDVDERVLVAVRAAVDEQTDRLTGTVSRLRRWSPTPYRQVRPCRS